MVKRGITDVGVEGKRILVRVDFNVSVEHSNSNSFDHRLRAAMPTIEYLLEHGATVIICSHLGRPNGQVVDGMRMSLIGHRLSALLSKEIKPLNEVVGVDVESAVGASSPGDILLLENLRFHPGEERNDPSFARALAGLADIYVMDAFAVAHRTHASTVGVPQYVPTVAGLLVQRELDVIGKAMESPDRPLAAILGGAKVSDKIMVIEHLLEKLDKLFIGGGMAATFLNALGYSTGESLVQQERLAFANHIVDKAAANGVELYLPSDVVIANKFAEQPGEIKTIPIKDIPDGCYIMDIGVDTVQRFIGALDNCRTVIWNGPMGVFEFPQFRAGTRALAEFLSLAQSTTVLGGGSTADALDALGLTDTISHVSTGGGASLALLGGETLPGIAAIPDKD